MDLHFNTALAEGYKSASQIARILTEDWMSHNMYCPICGAVSISKAPANAPVKDYICDSCKSQFELKSKKCPVYLTIDLDCLDPSEFPGTGTPEAGGISFKELLGAVLKVSRANVIAADINELAPMLDMSGASTALACKILRELMLALLQNMEER